MAGCGRARVIVFEPAVSRNAAERQRSKNIGRFILVFMFLRGHDILYRRPLARATVALVLCSKRRRAVQSIFHDLARTQFRVSI